MSKLIPLIILLVACSRPAVGPNKVHLTILHTNDHHGHYLKDDKGQIGMAARSTLIKRLRKEFKEKNIESLLLSGGDINTGTMASDLFDAEPDFIGMNKLGYDAMAVGNHEFDNSFEVIQKQQKIAGFPFLSANIFLKGTNKRAFDPLYIIKKYNGIKVGIFGLTTKDTPFKASHENAKEMFDFKNIIDSAREVVKTLKPKVDYIIALTHVGHVGSLTANGDIELAKAVDGIDVIVGGHSQEIINAENHNNTIIVQALDWGKYLGRLDLELTKNSIKQNSYKLIPVNLKKKVDGKRVYIEKEIKEDPEFLEVFAPYKAKIDKLGDVVLGNLDQSLNGDRDKVRRRQMPIAQFMGASMLNEVKTIEVGVINGGSIRSSLKSGDITRKKLHSLHPYGNSIVTVSMSARELFNYIQKLSKINFLAQKTSEGGNPHYINMLLTFKNKKLYTIEARDKTWSITIDKNKKIHSSKKSFTLGTMNFLARGGDNYPKITTHKSYTDTGFMINSAMMNYLEQKKDIKRLDFVKLTKDILTFK